MKQSFTQILSMLNLVAKYSCIAISLSGKIGCSQKQYLSIYYMRNPEFKSEGNLIICESLKIVLKEE